MSRIDYLPRTGMYLKAFKHIISQDKEFPYNQEDYDRIEKTKKYDPCKGTTSEEYDKLRRVINKWLNDHYKEQALYNKDLCNEKSEQIDQLKAEKEQAEQKLELIREKVQAYINDEADLTPEQVLQIIDGVQDEGYNK